MNSGGIGYSQSIIPKALVAAHKPIKEEFANIETIKGFSGIITGISTVMIGGTVGLEFGLQAPSGQAFTDLVATTPIFISETSVGHGVTSLNVSGANADVVGIGRTFVDNVYMVKEIGSLSNNAFIRVNVHSGINTTGIDLAKYGLSFSIAVTSSGSSNYILNGSHRDEFSTQTALSSAANGTVYVEDGDTVSFVNNMGAHPFRISRTEGGAALGVSDGVTNNGASNGTVVFNTTGVGHTTFHYYCTSHPNAMKGLIKVKKIQKGKFSWGRLSTASGNFVRNNPVSIGVTGNTVIAGEGLGISTFPTIQRRGFGIRDSGAIKRSHTP